MVFAATQPHRVEALVLFDTLVAMDSAPGMDVGSVHPELFAHELEDIHLICPLDG
jgi:hypothetical protein